MIITLIEQYALEEQKISQKLLQLGDEIYVKEMLDLVKKTARF
jgi:hypothetical protein